MLHMALQQPSLESFDSAHHVDITLIKITIQSAHRGLTFSDELTKATE